MLSGVVLAGYWLGSLGTRGSPRSDWTPHVWTETHTGRSGDFSTIPAPDTETPPASASQAHTRTSHLWESWLGQFKEEFDLIKSAAMAAVMNTMREMVKQSWPAIAPQVEKAIDSATAKLGAHPLPEGKPEQQAAGPARGCREQPLPIS